MPRFWLDDEVETLKLNWIQGLSFSAIGNLLKRERGSVSGKLHRLGLLKPRARDQIAAEPKAPEEPKPPEIIRSSVPFNMDEWTQAMERKPSDVSLPFYHSEPIDGKPPVSLLEVTRYQCRWVVKQDDVEGFCGLHAKDGSWCEHHAKLAFTTPTISNARFIRTISRNPNL